MQGSRLVDQVLTMPPIGDRAAVLKFFLRLRKQHVDVAFIGSRIEGRLPAYLRILAGIPVIVGDGTNKGSRIFYTVRNQINPEVHRVDRMLETFAMWSRRPPMAARFPIPRSEVARGSGDDSCGQRSATWPVRGHPPRFIGVRWHGQAHPR